MSQIPAALHFYVDVLGLERLGAFSGHDGYDGAIVGRSDSDWQIEFTRHESGVPPPSPTEEDLLVFYVSEVQLRAAARNLAEAGFGLIRHENPYWDNAGAVVSRDLDGYLVVLCPDST